MKKKYVIWLSIAIATFLTLTIIYLIKHNSNPLDVRVSNIKLNVEIERFDQDLVSKKMTIEEKIPYLEKKYDYFFEAFNYDIISIGGPENRAYSSYLQTFLNDYAVKEAYKAVDSVFNDIKWLNEKLTDGFKHYKYYFKEEETPRVIGFVAGFNHSIVTMANYVGIGLDKYLGANNKLYKMMQIPEFTAKQMIPERIPYDVMIAIAQEKLNYDDSDETLIKRMIYEGKILYFLDAIYPNDNDSIKHAYSKAEEEYCLMYERDMWSYIVDQKLLFSSDYLLIRNYCSNAPYTKDFGINSPPRTGNWLGWRIVHSYVKHQKISLKELLMEDDYQKILNLSRYNP